MIKIPLSIEGMACGMCESHINDAVRRAFPVKKVTSSHLKKQTVILSETDLAEDKLAEVINGTSYELKGISKEPYEKKGFFAIFKK